MKNKTTPHIPAHRIPERWFLIDADGKTVGRLATQVARLLMGKDMANFSPAVDAKTNVIIINSAKAKFTGNKTAKKVYAHHTGFLGGLKTTTPARILEGKNPERIVEKAIFGMLPNNKLSNVMKKRLYLYVGAEHPHAGQSPVAYNLK
ncbi:MAG: 50S ribosomal protein L13 [Patescibacteria group bacterium]|nr:50S ribosomal protein L13 [Patescibacteria group bacterium]